MRLSRFVPALAMLLVIASLAGCLGRNKSKDATPTTGMSAAASPTPITAQGVIDGAAARWSQTQSARFTLNIQGKAYVDDARTIQLRSAEGNLKRPDSVKATAKLAASLAVLDIQMIAIGQNMYITNFISGAWEKAPNGFSYNPAVLFSNDQGIGAVLKQLDSPKLENDADLNGRAAYVVSGTASQQTLNRMTAGAIVADNIPVKVWIAKDNSDILQVEITAPATANTEAGVWTLQVTDQDKDVTIEPPPVGSPGG